MDFELGKRLKRLRGEKRLFQKEVAKAIGVTVSAISKFEQGIDNPSRENVRKLANYYGVTVDYLLGSNDDYVEQKEFFSEGASILMKAEDKLSEDKKKYMLKIMKAFLEEEN